MPQEILTYYHEDPEYHQFLEIQAPETQKWTIADPTWDSGLRSILPISDWDGLHDTQLAVPATSIYSPEECEEVIRRTNEPKEMEEYVRKNREFLIALNNYFRRVRINFT